METPLTHESRRAFFRAQVIAIEAGEHEVTRISFLAALFVSPEIVKACQSAGFSVADLIGAFGLSDALRRLEDAEASLADQDMVFGSRDHIESLTDVRRPLSEELLQAVRHLDRRLASADTRVTVFDILDALIGPGGPLSVEATACGLTVAALRPAANDDGSGS